MTELLKQFYSKPRLIPGVQTINRFEPIYKEYLKQSVRELTHDEPLRNPKPDQETRYEYLKTFPKSKLTSKDRKQLQEYKDIENDVMSSQIVPYKGKPRSLPKKRGKRRVPQRAAVPQPSSEPPRSYPSMSSSITKNSVSLSAPTSQTRVNRSGVPKIRYRPNGDCRISHREFIYDLPGSVAFACTTFNINPGLPAFCNWLYRLAQSFESYIVHSLMFRFETESPTSSTGTVVLAVDYDAGDAAPTTKAQALAYRGTVRSAPWAPSCHTSLLEDLRKRSSYFVRGGSIAVGKDYALYDIGNLFLITQGMASTANVGEIWVEYDIEFRTPQTLSAGGGNAVWSQYNMLNNSTFSNVTGNLPATFVFTPGAAATAAFTFLQPWQGICSTEVDGTGIVFTGVNFTGTSKVYGSGVTDNGQLLSNGFCLINAVPGSTFSILMTNTTITTGLIYFTQGLGAFN